MERRKKKRKEKRERAMLTRFILINLQKCMNRPMISMPILLWEVPPTFKVKQDIKGEGEQDEKTIILYTDEKDHKKDMTQQMKTLKSHKAKLSPREMAYFLGMPSNGKGKSTEIAKIQCKGILLFALLSSLFCLLMFLLQSRRSLPKKSKHLQ